MEKLSISFWVLIILFWYTGTSFSCMEEERTGLLKFKPFAFARNNSEKSDCCGWNRVKCDNASRRIVSLDLSHLYGNDDYEKHVLDASLFLPFPQLQYLNLSSNWNFILQNHRDLGKLNKLEVLDLSYNYLNDTHIFHSLSTLSSLTVLNLSVNAFSGSLSAVGRELCKLRNMRELYLNWNGLSVSIPPCFVNFTSLKVLDLSDNNHFDGYLQDLGRLNKLEVLILSFNSLTDSRIFQSLSTLTSLTVLNLSANNFNASLSDVGRELCKLRNLQELYLDLNGISGSIPPCFNNLTSLKALDLSRNNLVGKLHPSLHFTSLEYLSLNRNPQFDANPMFSSLATREYKFRYLDLSDCNINMSTTDLLNVLQNGSKLLALSLSNNNLHGEFPNSIFKKNLNLKFLGLRNNSLTGRILLPVGHPVDLKWFDVSYNHLQGELQPNLGYVFQKLRGLNIANNNFVGEIPTSIHALKDLKFIDLSSNNFSGKLPERLDLSCKRLKRIYLSNNRLKGRIPGNILNLTELVVLDLSNNRFSGHIPTVNIRSFKLTTFNLNQNRLSGRIPSWLGNLTRYIRYIDLSENQLSGPVHSSLITGSPMHLHLQHNKLTGPLPNALPFNTSSLSVLDVSGNNLSGTIPNWFGFLVELSVLSLKGNHFSGSIPHELCHLQYIEIMDISHNILSGSLPSCFTNITFGRIPSAEWYNSEDSYDIYDDLATERLEQLFYDSLYIANYQLKDFQFAMKSRTNSYKGANIDLMSGMDLSCNNLEGDIPLNIGDLTELRAMNLSHNRFTGVIPSSLSKMKQIESLDLSHNKLSGKIPSNLTRLTFLVDFNVAYNNLSGRLPEMSAQFNTFSETSYEGNPFLCGPPLLKQCGGINSNLANMMDTLPGGDDKFEVDRTSFLASFAATYATFLLAFVIVLCINPHWRQRWFYFIDECICFVFPFWS